MRSPRPTLRLMLMIILAALLFAGHLAVSQAQERPTAAELLDELQSATGGALQTGTNRATGAYSMVRAEAGALLLDDDGSVDPAARAMNFMDAYGAIVGVTEPQRQLQITKVTQDDLGMSHVRLSQMHNGLPVFGAQLVVHMNDLGITAVNGTFLPEIALDQRAVLTVDDARDVAASAVAKDDASADTGEAALLVYPDGLLEQEAVDYHLAYAVEVRGELAEELIFVDAMDGRLLNRIDLRHTERYRIIYTPQYDPANPDQFVQATEDDPPNTLDLPQVHNLYNFAGQVYDFFFNAFGRDSYDGAGHEMRSVYLVNQNCPNAYWNGSSTNYCPGFDLDDVVAHEWGHAYTEYTHGLIYQWQSGALNESYSDIWGEVVDLHNGADGIGGSNNEEPYPDGQRWVVGEDLTDPVVTLLLRDMWDPERLGYPAKVTSSNYYCSTGDGGGVHYNSGVPNHAFAMLVDGKTFNGQTVEGIGFNKAVQIYWRAASEYQVPSTFFPEHADALEMACNDLVGTNVRDLQDGSPSGEVITAADCQQVAKAMAAVEMREEPLCDWQPILQQGAPEMCSNPAFVLNEDWESGTDGWTFTSQAGATGDAWPNYNWELDGTLPADRAGTGMFAIDEIAGTCAPGGDISGHFTMDSPIFTVPDPLVDLELRFDHYVATEAGYDGGNLKISINSGAFTVVPSSAYTFNPYNTTLASSVDGNTNPIAGEEAFSGSDEGALEGSWGTSVVDLTALDINPGDTVQLRWDFGVDGCNGLDGWYVDAVQAYTCDGSVTPTATPDLPTPTPTSVPPTPTPTVEPTTPPPAEQSRATGGGWLATTDGKKLNFSLDVESTNGLTSGDLKLKDKYGDVEIHIDEITHFGPAGAACSDYGENSAELRGNGRFNDAQNATFVVCLQNVSEPGKEHDRFFLACESGCDPAYNTDGRALDDIIDAGNIQVAHAGGQGAVAEGAVAEGVVAEGAVAEGAVAKQEVAASSAATLILDPILVDEGLAGRLQIFTVRAYDGAQNLLPGAEVTLTRINPGGASETFDALTGLDGMATFSLLNLSEVTEYTASANGVESNAIEVSPALP